MRESLGNGMGYEKYSDEALISILKKKNEMEIMDYLMDKYKNLVKKKANEPCVFFPKESYS